MKGLEALKRIGNYHIEKSSDKGFDIADTNDFDTIEKELKALEIIKKKIIDIQDVIVFYPLSVFNQRRILRGLSVITKKEYDLLKEVLL